jgi:hypothetical protein
MADLDLSRTRQQQGCIYILGDVRLGLGERVPGYVVREGTYRDEADPDDSNPGDDYSQGAETERARLKVLVVDQADEDGDGVCTPATQHQSVSVPPWAKVPAFLG